MKNAINRIPILFNGLALLLAIGPASAQGGTQALDLAAQPIVLKFDNQAAAPPTFDRLAGGRSVFKIKAAGTVSGTLKGTVSAAVTQLAKSEFDPISITFTIKTDQGTLEGYYAGTFYRSSEDFADITGHGYILSVSGAYADLFLADVFVTSQVRIVKGQGVSESGKMTLTAR